MSTSDDVVRAVWEAWELQNGDVLKCDMEVNGEILV